MADNLDADLFSDDNDEVVVTSDRLHDWVFDQVVFAGLPAIPAEERAPINWNCPDPLYTTKAIRYIGRQYELSFSHAIQHTISHGFAILEHKHASILDLVNNLDDTAITNDSTGYITNLVYKPVLGKNVRRLVTITDHETAERMGNFAATVGTSRSHLAGVCVLTSFCTGMLIPKPTIERFQQHIDVFERGLKIYEMIATNLI